MKVRDTSGREVHQEEINMGSHKIIDMTDCTANQDAATKKYVDDNLSAGLWEVDGSETQLKTADEIDMQTKKIINLVDPTAAQHADTKAARDAAIAAQKLDDHAAPDDNTDNNASITAHGLLPKLDNTVTNFLNGTGAWSAPAAALSSKLITATRDMTAASGDVSYTGVGFQPTVVICLSHMAGAGSWGFSDSAGAEDLITIRAGTLGGWCAGNLIGILETTTKKQEAVLKTYDADGFTLTWTRTGATAAGTGYLKFLCLK